MGCLSYSNMSLVPKLQNVVDNACRFALKQALEEDPELAKHDLSLESKESNFLVFGKGSKYKIDLIPTKYEDSLKKIETTDSRIHYVKLSLIIGGIALGILVAVGIVLSSFHLIILTSVILTLSSVVLGASYCVLNRQKNRLLSQYESQLQHDVKQIITHHFATWKKENEKKTDIQPVATLPAPMLSTTLPTPSLISLTVPAPSTTPTAVSSPAPPPPTTTTTAAPPPLEEEVMPLDTSQLDREGVKKLFGSKKQLHCLSREQIRECFPKLQIAFDGHLFENLSEAQMLEFDYTIFPQVVTHFFTPEDWTQTPEATELAKKIIPKLPSESIAVLFKDFRLCHFKLLGFNHFPKDFVFLKHRDINNKEDIIELVRGMSIEKINDSLGKIVHEEVLKDFFAYFSSEQKAKFNYSLAPREIVDRIFGYPRGGPCRYLDQIKHLIKIAHDIFAHVPKRESERKRDLDLLIDLRELTAEEFNRNRPERYPTIAVLLMPLEEISKLDSTKLTSEHVDCLFASEERLNVMRSLQINGCITKLSQIELIANLKIKHVEKLVLSQLRGSLLEAFNKWKSSYRPSKSDLVGIDYSEMDTNLMFALFGYKEHLGISENIAIASLMSQHIPDGVGPRSLTARQIENSEKPVSPIFILLLPWTEFASLDLLKITSDHLAHIFSSPQHLARLSNERVHSVLARVRDREVLRGILPNLKISHMEGLSYSSLLPDTQRDVITHIGSFKPTGSELASFNYWGTESVIGNALFGYRPYAPAFDLSEIAKSVIRCVPQRETRPLNRGLFIDLRELTVEQIKKDLRSLDPITFCFINADWVESLNLSELTVPQLECLFTSKSHVAKISIKEIPELILKITDKRLLCNLSLFQIESIDLSDLDASTIAGLKYHIPSYSAALVEKHSQYFVDGDWIKVNPVVALAVDYEQIRNPKGERNIEFSQKVFNIVFNITDQEDSNGYKIFSSLNLNNPRHVNRLYARSKFFCVSHLLFLKECKSEVDLTKTLDLTQMQVPELTLEKITAILQPTMYAPYIPHRTYSPKEIGEFAEHSILKKRNGIPYREEVDELKKLHENVGKLVGAFEMRPQTVSSAPLSVRFECNIQKDPNSEDSFVAITASAREFRAEDVKGLTTAFEILLDVSGSMEGTKLEQLKRSAIDAVNYCYKTSQPICISLYETKTSVLFPFQYVDTVADRDALIAKINSLETGGLTNTVGGNILAFTTASQVPGKVGKIAIIHITDGAPSGTQSTPVVLTGIQALRDRILGTRALDVSYSMIYVREKMVASEHSVKALVETIEDTVYNFNGFFHQGAPEDLPKLLTEHMQTFANGRVGDLISSNIKVNDPYQIVEILGSNTKPHLIGQYASNVSTPPIEGGKSRSLVIRVAKKKEISERFPEGSTLEIECNFGVRNLLSGKRRMETVKRSFPERDIPTFNKQVSILLEALQHLKIYSKILAPVKNPLLFPEQVRKLGEEWKKINYLENFSSMVSRNTVVDLIEILGNAEFFPDGGRNHESWPSRLLAVQEKYQGMVARQTAWYASRGKKREEAAAKEIVDARQWSCIQTREKWNRRISHFVCFVRPETPKEVAGLIAGYAIGGDEDDEIIWKATAASAARAVYGETLLFAKMAVDEWQRAAHMQYTEIDPGSMSQSMRALSNGMIVLNASRLFFTGSPDELQARLRTQFNALTAAGRTPLDIQEILTKEEWGNGLFRTSTQDCPRCVLTFLDFNGDFAHAVFQLNTRTKKIVLDVDLSGDEWGHLFGNKVYSIENDDVIKDVMEFRKHVLNTRRKMMLEKGLYIELVGVTVEERFKVLKEAVDRNPKGVFHHDEGLGRFVFSFIAQKLGGMKHVSLQLLRRENKPEHSAKATSAKGIETEDLMRIDRSPPLFYRRGNGSDLLFPDKVERDPEKFGKHPTPAKVHWNKLRSEIPVKISQIVKTREDFNIKNFVESCLKEDAAKLTAANPEKFGDGFFHASEFGPTHTYYSFWEDAVDDQPGRCHHVLVKVCETGTVLLGPEEAERWSLSADRYFVAGFKAAIAHRKGQLMEAKKTKARIGFTGKAALRYRVLSRK